MLDAQSCFDYLPFTAKRTAFPLLNDQICWETLLTLILVDKAPTKHDNELRIKTSNGTYACHWKDVVLIVLVFLNRRVYLFFGRFHWPMTNVHSSSWGW